MKRMSRWNRAAIAFTAACLVATGTAFAQTKPGIDVCAIVTPEKAKGVLKDLSPQHWTPEGAHG